jgi:hypothetical protein
MQVNSRLLGPEPICVHPMPRDGDEERPFPDATLVDLYRNLPAVQLRQGNVKQDYIGRVP